MADTAAECISESPRPPPQPFIVGGANSPGDRSGKGGPNQGSSGSIRRGGIEKFRTSEGNSKTASLPPHHLTTALLEIA